VNLAIVQARMSSTRLPGKVLAALHGRPMILRQLERLAQSTRIDTLVVATSTDATDDALAATLLAEGIEVRRGPLDDVAERFHRVVREFQPQTVVRLTADCPLCDPEVIDRVITEHIASEADYTSNVIRRTYPQGLDVECMKPAAFERLMSGPLTAAEREHVTIGLYSRPDEFTLHSVTQHEDLSAHRWTVDRPDDLEFVREVYDRLYDAAPRFRQADILDLVRRHPELEHTN
jgi:spore coat polysaccharide biosynthesis protein SpsF